MAKSQNQNQNSANPPQQKYELKVSVDHHEPDPQNGFRVDFEARAFLNGQVLANADVLFKQGVNSLGDKKTDANGVAILSHTFPVTDAGKSFTVRIFLAHSPDEAHVNINLPKLPKVKQASDNIEADRISLYSFIIDNNGNVTMNMRVIGDRGEALKDTKVNLVYRGQNHIVNTNECGHTVWSLPEPLGLNERAVILATTDSVVKACKLNIWNAPLPSAMISIHGLVARFSFIVLGILSLFSFVVMFVSLAGIFSKNGEAALKSSNPTLDILWILLFMMSWIMPGLLLANCIYYCISTALKRAKQIHGYRTSRFQETHSHDSNFENFVDAIKDMIKEKREAKEKIKLASSSDKVDSGGVFSEKRQFLWELFNEVFAEGFWHAIGGLFKKFRTN